VPRIFIREAGLPGSGNTDLLGVDAEGNIYIVECKLADNAEVRRKVIGQILEYAAYLWKLSYDEFDGLFQNREQKSIEQLFKGKLQENWEFETFTEQVDNNLRSGTFNLIIIVDKMNEELEQIIGYLSFRGANLRLKALELRLYGQDDIDVLVPQLHPEEEKTTPRGPVTVEQTIASATDERARRSLELLVGGWKKLGNKVEAIGAGVRFLADVEGKSERVFRTSAVEYVYMRFGDLPKQGVPGELIDSCREEVARIIGFDPQKVLSQPFPMARLASLDEQGVSAVLRANQTLVVKWRDSLARQKI